MKEAIKIFKALSDPNRLRVVKMLEAGELCVCEITTILGLAPSTVSKHLSILNEAGLILDEKRGKWVYYRLASRTPELIRSTLTLVSACCNDDPRVEVDRRYAEKVVCEIVCSK
ncbi:MAG: hypothetical protein SCALA702_07800 [Melioribacteraceae bacterium]|nr:MAG: hypothetical protein SCALA702_07800 [Melioribacteraceae bacterium]